MRAKDIIRARYPDDLGDAAPLVTPTDALAAIREEIAALLTTYTPCSDPVLYSRIAAISDWVTAGLAPRSFIQVRKDRKLSYGKFSIYRLFAERYPFHVGQTQDIKKRLMAHMARALGDVSLLPTTERHRAMIIREALRYGHPLEYEIVQRVETSHAANLRERAWQERTAREGWKYGYRVSDGTSLVLILRELREQRS